MKKILIISTLLLTSNLFSQEARKERSQSHTIHDYQEYRTDSYRDAKRFCRFEFEKSKRKMKRKMEDLFKVSLIDDDIVGTYEVFIANYQHLTVGGTMDSYQQIEGCQFRFDIDHRDFDIVVENRKVIFDDLKKSEIEQAELLLKQLNKDEAAKLGNRHMGTDFKTERTGGFLFIKKRYTTYYTSYNYKKIDK